MKNLLLSFLLLFMIANCWGKDGAHTVKRKRKVRIPPSALLIELHTERKRTAFLEKTGDTKRMEQLKKDAAKIEEATLADFKINFSCRPVYFFYDTDEDKIKDRNFEGVLMDVDKKVLAQSPIAATDSSYLIGYYGFPSADTTSYPDYITDVDDIYSPEMLRYSKVYGPPYGHGRHTVAAKGLVIVDFKFHETRTTRLFFKGSSRNLGMFRNQKINYSSPIFDIDYVQSARRLNNAINEYFRLNM